MSKRDNLNCSTHIVSVGCEKRLYQGIFVRRILKTSELSFFKEVVH